MPKMPAQHIETLFVRVLRALVRAGFKPTPELGEVLLSHSASILEKPHTRESFLALAAKIWDKGPAAAREIEHEDPAIVARADAEFEQIMAPHTPLEALEDLSRRCGDALAAVVPAGLNLGWAAFVFNREAGGFTAYASNSNRGDMVTMLAEFVAKCRNVN